MTTSLLLTPVTTEDLASMDWDDYTGQYRKAIHVEPHIELAYWTDESDIERALRLDFRYCIDVKHLPPEGNDEEADAQMVADAINDFFVASLDGGWQKLVETLRTSADEIERHYQSQ